MLRRTDPAMGCLEWVATAVSIIVLGCARLMTGLCMYAYRAFADRRIAFGIKDVQSRLGLALCVGRQVKSGGVSCRLLVVRRGWLAGLQTVSELR